MITFIDTKTGEIFSVSKKYFGESEESYIDDMQISGILLPQIYSCGKGGII